MISIALFATIYSSTTFTLFAVIIMAIATYEVIKLCADNQLSKLIGIAYIFLGCMSLIFLRDINILYIIFPFAVVWGCDTFAYFVGVTFGKHKMAPTISPKKSWEGTIGGVIAGTLLGSIILTHGDAFGTLGAFILSLECAVLTVFGDLLESALKRKMNVKDSGNIIPGHGGILDRIDGLIPVSLLVFLWVIGLELLKRI